MSENRKNRVVYRDHNTQYPRWVIVIEWNVSKPPPQFVTNNLTKEVSDNAKSEDKIIQSERLIYARKAKKIYNNYWKKNVDYVCVATFINATMDRHAYGISRIYNIDDSEKESKWKMKKSEEKFLADAGIEKSVIEECYKCADNAWIPNDTSQSFHP